MDEWARPGADEPSKAPRFEIPLAGDAADPVAPTAGSRGASWRRVVAVSGVAGVVLGVVVGVVIVTADDDDAVDESAAPTTTPDPDLSSSITSPPTLAPILTDAPDGQISGRGVDPLPTIAGVDLATLWAYDLDAALATLDASRQGRANTRYVAGADGFVLNVQVVHDWLNDRYRIELEVGDDDPEPQHFLLDPGGKWSYVRADLTGGEEWLRIPNDQIAEQTGSADVGELARSLLLGPVRPDTDATVVAAGTGLASLDGTAVREYTVEVAIGAVPEWAPYVFSPAAEAPPAPAGDVLTFAVHVDGDARLRRVAGVSAYGSTEQSIVHTFERMPRPEVIDLPTSFAILDADGEVVTDSTDLTLPAGPG